METLWVSAQSKPKTLAGAIAGVLRREPQVVVQAVGPMAVNQAVKAIAIARGYLQGEGRDLTVQPDFVSLETAAEERVGIRLTIFGYVIP